MGEGAEGRVFGTRKADCASGAAAAPLPRGPPGGVPARPLQSLGHVTTGRPSRFTAGRRGGCYIGDGAWVATVARERVEEKAAAAEDWGGDGRVQAAGGPGL